MGLAGVHGQVAVEAQLAARDLLAAQLDGVGLWVQPQVVADADLGKHDAQLQRDLPAQGRDALQQVAAACGVDQRDQAVADLQLQRVHLQQRRHVFAGFRRGPGLGSALAGASSSVRASRR